MLAEITARFRAVGRDPRSAAVLGVVGPVLAGALAAGVGTVTRQA